MKWFGPTKQIDILEDKDELIVRATSVTTVVSLGAPFVFVVLMAYVASAIEVCLVQFLPFMRSEYFYSIGGEKSPESCVLASLKLSQRVISASQQRVMSGFIGEAYQDWSIEWAMKANPAACLQEGEAPALRA